MSPLDSLSPEHKLSLVLGGSLALGSALGSQVVVLGLLGVGAVLYHQGTIPGINALLHYINQIPPPPPSLAGQLMGTLLGSRS